jgi:hypothetical protein
MRLAFFFGHLLLFLSALLVISIDRMKRSSANEDEHCSPCMDKSRKMPTAVSGTPKLLSMDDQVRAEKEWKDVNSGPNVVVFKIGQQRGAFPMQPPTRYVRKSTYGAFEELTL